MSATERHWAGVSASRRSPHTSSNSFCVSISAATAVLKRNSGMSPLTLRIVLFSVRRTSRAALSAPARPPPPRSPCSPATPSREVPEARQEPRSMPCTPRSFQATHCSNGAMNSS